MNKVDEREGEPQGETAACSGAGGSLLLLHQGLDVVL